MRRSLFAAYVAAVGIVLGGHQEKRMKLNAEEPGAQEPGPAEKGLFEGLAMPTLGGRQFWTDERFFHEWRIQRNAVTGHCRLLDGDNLRHASGTYEHCLATLEGIKQKHDLPPMQGKAVVALHGLGRSRVSMARLCKHLKCEGGYTVFNFGYASTRASIDDHAKALAKTIESLEGIDQISFVGQSMGNIVIRRYLARQSGEASGRLPDRRIKRFVMLGPPNHGSVAATNFADNKLVGAVLGKPGQELGREWVWLESELAIPPCEFGIVAGGRGNQKGFNPLLPGDDDGVVTVASTRLAGARDFILVPVFHSLLPTNRKVMQCTLSFLQNGYFVSEEKREEIDD